MKPKRLRRTQIYFEEDMLETLRKRAKESGTTLADVVRQAVDAFVVNVKPKSWESDAIWNITNLGDTNDGTLSTSHDEYLYDRKK